MARPFILLLTSHKGGVGQTTAALCLAYALGRRGTTVQLVDADSQQAALATACDDAGRCPWPNVVVEPLYDGRLPDSDASLMVVDGPRLSSPTARDLLEQADGVILTTAADPFALRTLPAAAAWLQGTNRPTRAFLGLFVGMYHADDPVEPRVLELLRGRPQSLAVDDPAPWQPGLGDWVLTPGAPPPAGPAIDVFDAAAARLAGLAFVG
ncbi:MAG: ParA family protein [Planctomycetia bacterium]